MKYSRNQIKTQRHILTCSIVAFEAFSNLLLLWTFTTLSWVQPFVSILYAEAHGHLPALPLQGDLMWSSGTSSLEQALPVSGASLTGLLFFMFYSSSSFAALPPSPEEPPPCVAHHAFHMRPWAVLWCSFLLLHIPFLAALRTMIPKSQMLLFTSLLIKILLNLQDPSQTLSPWWSSFWFHFFWVKAPSFSSTMCYCFEGRVPLFHLCIPRKPSTALLPPALT